MRDEVIDISGITPQSEYPRCVQGKFCIQICETDKFCLPSKKPSMECILQAFAKVCIKSFKVIRTALGRKLIIKGVKRIKILYVADDSCQSVHSAHFEVPFCSFILLKGMDDCKKVIDVFSAIEYIDVEKINCRCFYVSMIILACPIFKEKPTHHYHFDCDAQIDCNIHHCHNNDDDYDNDMENDCFEDCRDESCATNDDCGLKNDYIINSKSYDDEK